MSARARSVTRPAAMVCFDFEGRWGMPHSGAYDLDAATDALLEVLDRHGVRAVFFSVGQLALEHPRVITAIAAAGHELGLHGHRHRSLAELSGGELREEARGLADARDLIESSTGMPVVGFRAPYLLGPHFYRREVYEMLADLGIRWVSNREVRLPIEALRPDRLPIGGALWHSARLRHGLSSGSTGAGLLLAFNAGLCLTDRVRPTRRATARWLMAGAAPFVRDGLLEVPVTGPLDCDLVGFPQPDEPTPGDLLDYATAALEANFAGPGLRMLTFHDWIVASANRLSLLDRGLAALTRHAVSLLGRDLLMARRPAHIPHAVPGPHRPWPRPPEPAG